MRPASCTFTHSSISPAVRATFISILPIVLPSGISFLQFFSSGILGPSNGTTADKVPGDIEALITGAKYVKALIPAVVNIVYKKLLQYDITARAFTTRSTSFEGPLDEIPDENSPQILHRKMFLRAYLTKLCSDPSKMEFWEYLDKVGYVDRFAVMGFD